MTPLKELQLGQQVIYSTPGWCEGKMSCEELGVGYGLGKAYFYFLSFDLIS